MSVSPYEQADVAKELLGVEGATQVDLYDADEYGEATASNELVVRRRRVHSPN